MENKDIILRVEHVSKLYGPNRPEAAELMRQGLSKEEVYKKTGCTVALWDVNLEIPRDNIFVIIGLSGSGKSTVVRCLNRLNIPGEGRVYFEGRDLGSMGRRELLELRRSKVSMVFQSFGLMSHRDVLGNVAYGLEVKGVGRREREEKAREVIELVGLSGWESSRIDQLSGGMRQRVGIARALANDPEVLLMDEPFSALDPLVRQDMQFELLQLQRKLKKTIVFITHDMDEAFKLGDTVAIMRSGRVVQVDTPERMSFQPADDYVRDFIGSADKSKVLTARSVMITPVSLVRLGDPPEHALREMRTHALSTVYVVDHELRLAGILSVQNALRAYRERLSIAETMETSIEKTAPDALLADIMPTAAETPYPIAVTDPDGVLLGIVTKASVLSSLT